MYYIVYGFFWLLSLLPLRVLYILSDCIYGFVFYIKKYRRGVVMSNLKIAFPEKTEKERLKIAKQFYHNMIDTFIETIKMVSASQKFIQKHFTGNWEVINNLKPTGRKVQVHIGHNFNWEWGNAAAAKRMELPYVGAYMPLKNKTFNRFFYNLRSKHGTLLVSATNMREDMLPHHNTQYMIGLATDQNPGHPASALWFNFFGRPTPFISKTAKSAIDYKCAVVFGFIHKKKRGYYNVVFTLVEENAANTNEVELTRKFVRYMEGVIRQYPEMWLWSHRRWKHQWKEEYGPVRE
ncbi:MAG: lysophospholipid acyltransferase family protein [Chitinophagaceae bacterium]